MNSNKAIIAAVLAGLASLLATLQGRPELDTMRAIDWVIVVLAAVVTGLTVYTVPNKGRLR